MLSRSSFFSLLPYCCLMIFLIFSVKSYAADYNQQCAAEVSGNPSYSLGYTLDSVNITSKTRVGTVVGRLLLKSQSFRCSEVFIYDWYLQVAPGAIAYNGQPTVCRTNIDGIGIEYLDLNGQPVPCDKRGAIFYILANNLVGQIKEGTVLARLYRETGYLPYGNIPLNIAATLQAYVYGYTNSTPWGRLDLQGNNMIYTTPNLPQIYFPTSPNSTPVIDLNIDNSFHGNKVSSTPRSQNLDMCLFDGDNSSSSNITLTFSDEATGIVGKAPEIFSVFKNGGSKSDIKDRLDYIVSVVNPVTGSQEQVKNSVAVNWFFGSNTKKPIQQVELPGVGPALCIPSRITISTPSLDISEKSAGHYTGVLRVIYTPSTYAASSK